MNKGVLFLISGPSGAGKGTVLQHFLPRHPEMFYSISATTRKPRPGEIDGKHYYFMSSEEFESLKKENGFLESATFCGNSYGTPKKAVFEKLEQGIDVLLEIEVQGALQVMESYPEGVFVFIAPPSMEELRSRLIGRNTEKEDVIETRLMRATEEMKLKTKYTYTVVNDYADRAAADLEAILTAEKLRNDRQD